LEKTTYITRFVSIRKNTIFLNGEKAFENPEEIPFSEFSKNAYKNLEMNYPKFYKMDDLSKLALLASETLFQSAELNPPEENIALILANKSASLDTDVKHQQSIANADSFYPSPAIFVYTLANICLGEISIKYKLQTENAFFVFPNFNSEFICAYTNQILQTGKAEKAICGWIELFGNDYEAFVYLIEEKGEMEHNANTIKKLYTT
jgi:hypothetical protein